MKIILTILMNVVKTLRRNFLESRFRTRPVHRCSVMVHKRVHRCTFTSRFMYSYFLLASEYHNLLCNLEL